MTLVGQKKRPGDARPLVNLTAAFYGLYKRKNEFVLTIGTVTQ